jgi:hypothetical protein
MTYKEFADPAQLEGYFGILDFPIAKDDIIQRVEQEGAGDDVVSYLKNLPDKMYESQMDLKKEIGKL